MGMWKFQRTRALVTPFGELKIPEATPQDVKEEEGDDGLIEEGTHKGKKVLVRRSARLRARLWEKLKDGSMDPRIRRDVKTFTKNTPVLEEPGSERTHKVGTARKVQNISGKGHKMDALRHGSLGQVSLFGAKDGEELPVGTEELHRVKRLKKKRQNKSLTNRLT